MLVTLAYTLSIGLMIAAPLILAARLRRRAQVPWALFLVGVATFIGSQLVHFPLNDWLTDLGWLSPNLQEPGRLLPTALLLGLTAGLCEELSRTVGYALLRRHRRFEDGLMMGLGHGGIEAMVFGGVLTAATLSSLAALQGTDLTALNLSEEQLNILIMQMEALNSPLSAVLPLLERLIAIALHGTLSMMVWRAFDRRNAGYIGLAIAYHALVDCLAVLAHQYQLNPWLIELGLIVLLIPAVLWVWSIRPRGEAALKRHPVAPFTVEWRTFGIACRKELLQLGRTRRVLVVGAVFLLFGLFSPLSARFMTEIIKSMPGAEQFAALIPVPTAADALTQYVKNLTQFGFILAILLGMNAIAGEKEKGTAALIMSKPLPRWAFVLSKFVAQAALYTLGFALSTAAAYGYTRVLFGPVHFGSFLACNGLLLLWLLDFVAVTVLGSALGNSTGAAAGIGLGGAVLLLLSGNIPTVGPLMPGGLLAWASQIGLGLSETPVPANAGALAANLVLIILLLLGALAAFERQEL